MHALLRIPITNRRKFLQDLRQHAQILLAEIRRLHVLPDPLRRRRTRDGDDVAQAVATALSEHPAHRDLRRRCAFLRGYLLHLLDELEVLVEDFWLEAGERSEIGVRGHVEGGFELARLDDDDDDD